MDKVEIEYSRFFNRLNRSLKETGLLLVSAKKDGSANVMTIGWCLMGRLWRRDFALIAVRPSRYTFSFIEDSGEFTINVPTEKMSDIVDYCGTVTGRDEDKFKRKNLEILDGNLVSAPIIGQCCLNFECRVAFKHRLRSGDIPEDVFSTFYSKDDLHTLYYGEILKVYANRDIGKN